MSDYTWSISTSHRSLWGAQVPFQPLLTLLCISPSQIIFMKIFDQFLNFFVNVVCSEPRGGEGGDEETVLNSFGFLDDEDSDEDDNEDEEEEGGKGRRK